MAASTQVDIRWKQRLENFLAAFSQLKQAVELSHKKKLSDLEKQGLIQAFEFTHELAWIMIKDYFEHQGGASLITGSRDAAREAFNKGLIENGDVWMEMIRSRNKTSHTYNKGVAEEIVEKILRGYFSAFDDFRKKMQDLSEND